MADDRIELVSSYEVLVHGHGHSIRFYPGVPQLCPKQLVPLAMSKGVMPTSHEPPVVIQPKQTPEESKAALSEEERHTFVTATINDMLHENVPNEFGSNGKPLLEALNGRLLADWNFTINAHERDVVWAALKDDG